MNDNDIILGLKCLSDEDEILCKDCAFRDMDRGFACKKDVSKAALDLIHRQKAEIERLTSTQDILKIRLDNCLHFAEEKVEFEKEKRDLLLRLKQCDTEIESIKIALEVTMDNLGGARAELQKAEAEIDRLEALSESLGNDVDVKLEYIHKLEERINTAKAEAIKEFAERLKKSAFACDVSFGYGREHCEEAVTVLEIDNLVKEMLEE